MKRHGGKEMQTQPSLGGFGIRIECLYIAQTFAIWSNAMIEYGRCDGR